MTRIGIRPADVPDLPREALPALLTELALLQVAVADRLAGEPEQNASPVAATNHDLTESEVAERLRKSVRWVTDNWRTKGIPGRKRGRTTVFPELELERWRRRS